MEPEAQTESEAGKPSALQSIWNVLLAPDKTFRALAARPRWLAALLLLVVSALALALVITPRLDMKQYVRDAIEQSGQEVPEAQIARQAAVAESFKWVGVGAQVVLQPAIYLAIGGIFLVVFRMMGSELDFRRSLTVVVHAMVPFAIAAVLAIPAALSRAEISMEEVQRGGLLPSNLAAFASEDAGKTFLSLLSSIDLFSIWSIVLLAIGYRVVGQVSKPAAWGVVLTLWAIVVAGKVALASIF